LRERNLRILVGRVGETGLAGTESFVRPRPVYSVGLFAVYPFTGAPSATADTTSGSCFDDGAGRVSSMGESGGGGMFVPAVSESRGARTGSSNRPREVNRPLGGTADGMFVDLFPAD